MSHGSRRETRSGAKRAVPVQCHHGMPTPGSCIACMDEGVMAPPPPAPKREGWPFEATYASACAGAAATGCVHGERGIQPGDMIVRMSDGAYRHVGPCEKRRNPS